MALLAPPPTNNLYPSLDALITNINAHAKTQGYAVAKARSKARAGTTVKVNLRCSLGGVPRFSSSSTAANNDNNPANSSIVAPIPSSTRQRQRPSPKTNCPFDAYAVLKKQNSGQWELHVRNGEHNHAAFRPEDSAVHRRDALTQEVYDEIRERVARGEGPGGIWEEMRKGRGEGWLVGRRDVANAVREVRMGRVRKRALRKESGDDGGGRGIMNGEDDGGDGIEDASLGDVADLLNGSRWPEQGHGISVNSHFATPAISLSRLEENGHGANQAKGDECYRPGMKLFLVRFDMD